MENFTFYSPTYFVFGKDEEMNAGKYVKRFGGTKVLIHYGGGSVVRSGLLDRVKKSLADEGLSFVELGGHQIQLNTVDADTLKAAQANPEKYAQLIVRIWGWSAYFVELDKRYQDHVIARSEYRL